MNDARYPVCFLRASVLPASTARLTSLDSDVDDWTDAQLAERLRQWWSEPLLPEAIALASPPLHRTMARLAAGERLPRKRLLRAFHAIAKYLLRMSSRPTPFGTMAGVAAGSVAAPGEPGRISLGDRHRRFARPDWAWLTALLAEWEVEPDVVECLTVVRNNLAFVRGDRWVNPNPDELRPPPGGAARTREKSVRLSPPVRLVRELAALPTPVPVLVAELTARFPGGSADGARTLLRNLIREEFLVSDLWPPFHEKRPLDHVCAVLSRRDSAKDRCARLDEIAQRVDDYEAAPAADRVPLIMDLARRAAAVGGDVDRGHLQVDLKLDATMTLPYEVAAEAERAAYALRRMTSQPREASYLAQYRADFIERYGLNTVVPLVRALDPERGIGSPAGYESPLSHRKTPGTEFRPDRITESDVTRGGYLAARVQEALLDGSGCVVLSDEDIPRFGPTPETAEPLPGEVGFHVLSASPEDLSEGRFTLVLAPYPGSSLVLNSVGRFMHMLDEAPIGRVAARAGHFGDGELACHLSYRVLTPRNTNIARHAAVLPRTIHVGTYHDPADRSVLDLDDVGVYADLHSLRLRSLSTGKEILPRSYSMLNALGTNNVARFLREITHERARSVSEWTWGPLEVLPYLPRVVHGRTVLAKARWMPPAGLGDAATPAERDKIIAQWRAAFRVPDAVQLSRTDHRVSLDLGVAYHREILRRELARTSDVLIFEEIENSPEGLGWLAGHAHEAVLPLVPADRVPKPAPVVDLAPREVVHRPGGEWHYAKLYLSDDLQDAVLRGPIRRLVDGLSDVVDRWFFLRYTDPEPHLRLRWHRADPAASALVRDRVDQVLAELCEQGYAARFVIDQYLPELSRYGGGELMTAAEDLFCADSRIVLALLDRPDWPPLDAGVLTVLDLTRSLRPDDWREWLVETLPHEQESAAYRDCRQRVERRSDGLDDLFALRAEAARRYGELLADRCPENVRTDAILSMLHMHFNRLATLGRSKRTEHDGYVVARHIAKHALGAARKNGEGR